MYNIQQDRRAKARRSQGHRRISATAKTMTRVKPASVHLKHRQPYTFIDLFAGVGGFHLAMQGLAQCVMASEWDEQARFTYALNFGEELGERQIPFVTDIDGVDRDAVPDHTILCGGFPCQPFSKAGNQLGFAHEHGNLFFSIMHILKAKHPRVVFLENVKNLVSHEGGKTFAVIKDKLEAEGYHLKYQVLDGATHGNVAQHRERIFIVCFREPRDCEHFVFPDPIPCDHVPLCIKHSHYRQDREFYAFDQDGRVGQAMQEAVKKQGAFYRWWRCRVREKQGGVCPTLMANLGTVPVIRDDYGIRKLTPRECFDLQGFPEDFILPALANGHLYKQAGNSIVVPVVRRIAQNIVTALEQTDLKASKRNCGQDRVHHRRTRSQPAPAVRHRQTSPRGTDQHRARCRNHPTRDEAARPDPTGRGLWSWR